MTRTEFKTELTRILLNMSPHVDYNSRIDVKICSVNIGDNYNLIISYFNTSFIRMDLKHKISKELHVILFNFETPETGETLNIVGNIYDKLFELIDNNQLDLVFNEILIGMV